MICKNAISKKKKIYEKVLEFSKTTYWAILLFIANKEKHQQQILQVQSKEVGMFQDRTLHHFLLSNGIVAIAVKYFYYQV